MIDREKVIELAQKAGARMVYVWGNPNPTVEHMDILLYTKYLIEEALNGHDNQDGNHTGTEERTDSKVVEGGSGPDPDVRRRRKGTEKAEEGISSGN